MKTVIFHIDVNSAFLSWTAIRLLAAGETVDIRTIPAAIAVIYPNAGVLFWQNPFRPNPSELPPENRSQMP